MKRLLLALAVGSPLGWALAGALAGASSPPTETSTCTTTVKGVTTSQSGTPTYTTFTFTLFGRSYTVTGWVSSCSTTSP